MNKKRILFSSSIVFMALIALFAHIFSASADEEEPMTSLGDDVAIMGNVTTMGKVGIGTMEPAAKLDILGNVRISSGTKSINLYEYNGNNFVDADGGGLYIRNIGNVLIADNGGNVGIGTGNPTTKLHVEGIVPYRNLNTAALMRGHYAGIMFESPDLAQVAAIHHRSDDGSLTFWTKGTSGDFAASDEKMRVTASGNIGIGTTGPGAPLHVVGGTAASLNSPAVRIENNKFLTFFDSVNSAWALGLIADTSNNGSISGNNALIFNTGSGNTERVRITSTGNIGIGTADPTAKLHIANGTIRIETPKTPTSSSDPCDQGEIAWDANAIYVCVSANAWKKAALASF